MKKLFVTLALLGVVASAVAAPSGKQGIYLDQDLSFVQMSLSKSQVLRDTPVTVTWVSYSPAPGCVISGLPEGDYWGGGSGSHTFTAQASTTITVTCIGEIRPVSRSKGLYVAPDGTLPEVRASFSPSTVMEGDGSTLSWSSTYADSCSSANLNTSTSGSEIVNFIGLGYLQYPVSCSNRFGSTTSTAYLSVLKRPPEVSIFAIPFSLPRAGNVDVYTITKNTTFCDRLPWTNEFIWATTTFWITCTNDAGSATARTVVTVGSGFAADQGLAAQKGKQDDEKAAQKEFPKLQHLGIDLKKEGIEFVLLDLNQDKELDALVMDTLSGQLHVLLGQKGRFANIHKTFDNVASLSVVDMVYIEKDAAQTTHLLFKK